MIIRRCWSLNIVYNLVTHNDIISDRKSYFAFCQTTQLKTFSEAANQNKSQFYILEGSASKKSFCEFIFCALFLSIIFM